MNILTCPCCGSTPTIRTYLVMVGVETKIKCPCGLSMTKWDDNSPTQLAIDAWNKMSTQREMKDVEIYET